MALTEQLTQFEERLLDQTEELQRATTGLDQLRRERDTLSVTHEEQMQRLVNERYRLQVR